MTFARSAGVDMTARCRPRSASPRLLGTRPVTLKEWSGNQWPQAPGNLQTYGEVLHANTMHGFSGASQRRAFMTFSDHRRRATSNNFRSPNDLLTASERFTAFYAVPDCRRVLPGFATHDALRAAHERSRMHLEYIGTKVHMGGGSAMGSARMRGRSS